MWKTIGTLFLFILFFVSGYLVASWNFVYGTTYVLTESIVLESGQAVGELPAGTELHYQSMAHGEIDYYVFVRMPLKKSMEIRKKVEVDTYNGIKRLKGGFE
ncbi:hypothetical protein [Simiduia agarivorans]|uniref:Uncharacterized protein n=2 Tax=Simiduia TaxID=447467 RepID=K4KLE2_SIMAS|nr:hypothetical protein [Simiduia agarivorans]AFU99836.2 hypothetical protein M5M_13460 [Simiduia agarivorans SA1 = DSM 21679]